MLSAPDDIRYCCRCAAAMTTRAAAGKPRRVCSACGYIHFIEPKVGVGVMVVEDGQLLLVQRAIPPAKGRWSLPAGYADVGESPPATAVREVLEETGLQVEITRLVDVYHNPPEQGGASIFILYQACRISGHLQAADDAMAAGFFALDELPELAFSSTHDAVRRLCAEAASGELSDHTSN